ncbi:SHOCT domain-containing protein [Priestia megaterium]|uniref:SHOCT domain-containing protein n=1 Tax=Priestia megaterium TaxID=1404 RepID=UPI00267639F5|nr:SHOCT domain-containing protein [Priestia megaterium]WKU21444.1 SHOCT domain-containing protein [Priestia megaterium]
MGFLFFIALVVVAIILYKKKKDKEFLEKSRANWDFYDDSERELIKNHGFSKESMSEYRSHKLGTTRHIVTDRAANKIAFILPEEKSLRVTTGEKILSVDLREEMGTVHREGDTRFGGPSASSSTFVKSIDLVVVTEDIGSIELNFHDDYLSERGYDGSAHLQEHRAKAIQVRSTIQKIMERTQTTSSGSVSVADEILRLDSLFKEGVINEEEFNKAKDKLLA